MSGIVKRLQDLVLEGVENASKVFIVGHDGTDFDCIGSAFGLSTLTKSLGKETYIIINDSDIEIDPGIKKIIDEKKEKYQIINLEEFRSLVDDHSTLIVTDTNKTYKVSVKDDLDKFEKILVIDHHQEDENTIATPRKVIASDPKEASSASEMVARLLNSLKIKYDAEVAIYLLTGITMDSNHYDVNTTHITMDVSEKLIRKGATVEDVKKLLFTDIAEDGRIQLLIHTPGNTIFQEYAQGGLLGTKNVAFTINREKPKTIYNRVEIAKAANNMLKYNITDATFVLAYTKAGTISISARSREDINVGTIMEHMQYGGGSKKCAGGIVMSDDIFAVEKELMQQVQWGLPLDTPQEEVKIKKIGKVENI